jgi:hypothetical protein
MSYFELYFECGYFTKQKDIIAINIPTILKVFMAVNI